MFSQKTYLKRYCKQANLKIWRSPLSGRRLLGVPTYSQCRDGWIVFRHLRRSFCSQGWGFWNIWMGGRRSLETISLWISWRISALWLPLGRQTPKILTFLTVPQVKKTLCINYIISTWKTCEIVVQDYLVKNPPKKGMGKPSFSFIRNKQLYSIVNHLEQVPIKLYMLTARVLRLKNMLKQSQTLSKAL